MKAAVDRNGARLSLTAVAYEQISRKIINLEYAPGQSLEEKKVMEGLEMGRTPIREALWRLAGEGLLESVPNKGMRVPSITLQGVKATFEAMKIMESGVASLAVRQSAGPFVPDMRAANEGVRQSVLDGDVLGMVEANHRFHIAFAKCSRNEFLIRGVREVRSAAKRLSYLSYANELDPEKSIAAHLDSVISEHMEMMRFLAERNEDSLQEAIVRHNKAFQHRIVLYMTF